MEEEDHRKEIEKRRYSPPNFKSSEVVKDKISSDEPSLCSFGNETQNYYIQDFKNTSTDKLLEAIVLALS